MSPLHGLQADFQSFLLRGDERMLDRVIGNAKVSAPRRLAIYYDAYRLRLLEALDSNYPVLHAWMGDDEFEKLGLAYLEAHPSTHFSIRYFGHRLCEYLASAETYRDKPYLGEMAALEWAMSEAFDAPDSPGVDLDAMATIPPEAWPEMRLALHASVHRLDLRWNVPAVWKAIKEDQAPEEPSASEWPQPWLVWRQDLKIFFRSLSVDEAWAIDAARAYEPFASICEGLVEWIDAQNVALHAAGLLKRWMIDGMIVNITPGNK
jgi:hypothetical protein